MWGPSIMKGYFKNPEKTAECMTPDGWIFTGDVGLVKKNGVLKIIDRAKNIFKLS
jgi:long-chain acyl-CoA synthetase